MNTKDIAAMVGEKAEEFAEKAMDNFIGNKEDKKEQPKGGAEQEKPKDDNGFGLGDALSMVTGGDDDKKKKEGEGGGVAKAMGALGGLFS